MKHLYTYSIFFFLSLAVNAQVVINEVSYTNTSIFNDEHGAPEDWIELYNSGSTPVSLQNYSLMKNNSKQWYFPSMTIPAYGFLKLLASGRDTIISGAFRHMSFKISNDDYKIVLKNAIGAEVDEFYIQPSLQTDHSYGRNPDGSQNWCFFNIPSFGGSNNSSTCYPGYEPAPVMSNNGGFFTSPQIVSVNSSSGQVRYTDDGSIPTLASPVYAGTISVNSTRIVAARTFSTTGKLPSTVVKKTFFINENNIEMPIFSVTIDPVDLFDSTTGMYVTGPNADTAFPHFGANYWKDIEKQCYVEYFDVNNIKRFETAAGLKIFGGYSRTFPQKSFKIKCRAHYGLPELMQPLIPEKKYISSYRDIILRNGGTDNGGTHFRDAFMQRIMKSQFVDYMAYQPAVVYLNGSFWGFYEIRERQDEVYIEKNHGYEADQIDFLEHSGIIYTIAGSDTGFYNMYNYITTADAASSSYYTGVSKMLDVENFTDYFIAETYYGNTDWVGDWVNNIKLWRPKEPGGKWRYILWDLDWGMGLYSAAHKNYLNRARFPFVTNEHSEMFDALLANTQFRNYFVNRYADLINTKYTDANVQKTVFQMRDEINAVMNLHFNKWGGTYSAWTTEINNILAFNNARKGFARDHIQAEFNLTKQVDVELDVMPAGSGKIKISTVTPDSLPWKGVYFDGVPVKITAMPNTGYTFTHWTSNTGEDRNESFERNISADDKFVAHFESNEFGFDVYPNPVSDLLSITYELPEDKQVSVNVYSVIGKKVMEVVSESLQKSGRHSIPFSFKDASLADGMYIVKIDAEDYSKSIKVTKNSK